MKLLLLPLIIFITSMSAKAELEATSFQQLRSIIERTQFNYKETGKVFGFVSTQSCLFTAPGIAIFRNYCFPVRNYPAQGYTIISREFGVIDLYEEEMSANLLKRDIRITQFPSLLAPYLDVAPEHLGLKGLSSTLEKMHYNYFPACWSTNYSHYLETPEANCTKKLADIIGFSQWERETQTLLNDEVSWKELMKELKGKFKN